MKSRLTIIVAALGIAAFAACIAWALGFFEPRYGGVPASTYLRNVISQDRFGGEANKQKILAVPPRVGVPILIRFTQAQDPRWRGWYQRFYTKLPQFITRRLGPPKSNAGMLLKSVRALGYYGADAHSAVPQLLKLEAGANSPVPGTFTPLQQAAVETLGAIGPGASNAIPVLVTRFQSRSYGIGVAGAMAKIDLRGERTGALLVSHLTGDEMTAAPIGRFFFDNGALGALASMAVHEPKWTHEIWRTTEMALSPDSKATAGFVPRAAACLQRLGALDAARVKVICNQSQHADPMVRQSIADALAFATEHAYTTMPVLLKYRAETNNHISAAACRTLLRYVQSTNVDVQLRITAVRAVLSCDDEGNKWQALTALQQLGPAAASTLEQIIVLLSDSKERIRGKAAETIAALGPAAASARVALEVLRDDKWAFVRDAAETALKNITSKSSSE